MQRPKPLQQSAPRSDAATHHLVGGALCLDFANTLYGHGKTPLHEYLFSYRDLVLWSRHAAILSAATATDLLRQTPRFPNDALVVFHRALALRETLFRFFSTIAQGGAPSSADLNALNLAYFEAISHSRIDRADKGFTFVWNDKTALDQMLWHIAVSAVELLTSAQLDRVRQCSGAPCDWLFVDASRNHLRRWCSMSVCGNRAKARQFAQRQRKRLKRSSARGSRG